MKIITRFSLMLVALCCWSLTVKANEAADILFVSAAHSNKAKVGLLHKAALNNPSAVWNIKQKNAKDLTDMAAAQSLFSQYDLVVLDAVSPREASKTYQAFITSIANTETKFIAFNWLDNQAAQKGISEAQQQTLQSYWKNAGLANLNNMLSYIAYNLLGHRNPSSATVPEPIIFPTQGIYHPNQAKLISESLAEYQQWSAPKANQAKIALLMQRALIETEQTQLIDTTIALLEAKGAYVVPFFFELSPVSGDYSHLLQSEVKQGGTLVGKQTEVDLIINFRNIHWANKRKLEFEQFGVPVMQAMTYYSGDQQAWEADMQGVAPGMMAFTLVLPETAGVVDPMVVAATDRKTQTTEIISYQLEHLVNKAVNVANLKYKANQDKKLTVFVWGDKDVGASFMNIPASIEAISQRLAAEGYQTGERDAQYITANIKKILDPFYRDFELTELLEQDLAELMPIDEYLAWFNSLPAELTKEIRDHWGEPKENFMAVEKNGKDYFILPRIRNGNMLVMRQPSRSDNKNDENQIYHQGLVPMNHFYLAAYFYARQYWQSDAIVHLGTHGSQEYLGGKERGLSIYDQGNLAVWDTPVVYPFIVDDVGEAMQTKRRGRATVISHMTPPFAAAGLHGDMSDLHELMHQYKALDQGGVKQKTAKLIAEKCIEINICNDIGWNQTQIETALSSTTEWSDFFSLLHSHMESLATANQPLGLHTFGALAEQDLVISTLVQMLGRDFTGLATEFEHQNYLNQDETRHAEHGDEEHSHSYHNTSHKHDEDSDHEHSDHEHATQAHQGDELKSLSVKKLAGYLTALNYIIKDGDNKANRPIAFDDLDEALQTQINRGIKLYQNMAGIRELDSMVDFLQAKYIPVKTGGDPIRHPESLATGYNLYGFDPSRVPTPAAYQQGQELVEEMIANYQKKHNTYPDKMAFSLWSIETMRHYGVLESQILYAMGVKPKWTPDGRVIGTEVIPYSELKRPRVDVVMSATGLYRDAFPNVMQLLAKAVKQVAELKQESNSIWDNFVQINSEKVKQSLIEQGVAADEAEYLSSIRMFSNQSGDYGSGVDDSTWASDTWESDKKISDNYLGKMGYFFGPDSSRWGEKAVNAQGEDVQLYAKQLSGTDLAMFARSSNLFGMLSTDDPFEYFGALSLAVRNIDGKSPDMVVANLRDANNAKAEDAALFMAKELRTRNFHPRWIAEMQKEGYSGAVSMASRIDNFFGWQVVDPNLVRNDQWDEFMDVYLKDKLNLGLDEWFEEVNPTALARMMERMLEAERKDYWQADPERLKQLVEKYVDFVNQYDLIVLNDALREHVDELAKGFGSQALQAAKTAEDMAAQAMAQKAKNQTQLAQEPALNDSAKQQVEGQKLEKQTEQSQTEDNDFIWQCLAIIALIMLLGAIYQTRQSKQANKKFAN
ncbi:cobaltochelatase subunit CobN [Catenovulum maritimum]|uniref:cobaltochelatase subunit CobN n=1 Tax=Catenovulum maritimum TaxID=1513271 RepID=UPI000660C379|nr:cobaltochelatase subunit CobN [Catenovulum maritimum]